MLALILSLVAVIDLSGLSVTLKPPSSAVFAGDEIVVPAVFANTTRADVDLPKTLDIEATVAGRQSTVHANYSGNKQRDPFVAPGRTIEAEYTLRIPDDWTDNVALRVAGGRRATIVVKSRPEVQVNGLRESKLPSRDEQPSRPLFSQMRELTAYEPNYFLVGDQPGTRFQISIKHQLLSDTNSWVTAHPELGHIYLGYTQTSLWDISGESGPFVDSSYKPTGFWQHKDIGRLELLNAAWGGEAGIQHESNGKSGADSRSLNVAFLQPILKINPNGASSVTFAPRLNLPITDPDEENSDIERYRGYVDYHLDYEFEDALKVALLGRLGTSGKGSIQADVTYPMNRWGGGWPDLYLQFQYFHGYGETLRFYNESEDEFRVGFAVSR